MEHTAVTVRPRKRRSRSKRGVNPPREQVARAEQKKETKTVAFRSPEVSSDSDSTLEDIKSSKAALPDTDLKLTKQSEQIPDHATSPQPHVTSPTHAHLRDPGFLELGNSSDSQLLDPINPMLSTKESYRAERWLEEISGDTNSEQWLCWILCWKFKLEWVEAQVLIRDFVEESPRFAQVGLLLHSLFREVAGDKT